MSNEVLAIFAETSRQIFLDCTLGTGGHAQKILEKFPQSRLIGIDTDANSINIARNNLQLYLDRCHFICARFENIFEEQFRLPFANISGILVDPGLSLWQIRESQRGFSHSNNEYLDMRKDRAQSLTARDVLNSFSLEELAKIFIDYGELPVLQARELSRRVIEYRLQKPLEFTSELRRIIEEFFHWHPARGKTHPAARVFQALRIYINQELENLQKWLMRLPDFFHKGCRLVFLSYHSLEDRIVKSCLQHLKKNNQAELLKPFPLKPTPEEIALNSPSRSAKLRACEFIT